MIVWLYSLVSVFIISLISLIGISTFSLKEKELKKILLLLVSFSAGGLFGNAFFHLIPKAAESGFEIYISVYILLGIIFSFFIEKFLQWRHCHIPTSEDHPHSFAYMNLFGDAVHNLLDGLIIGGSYLTSTQLGVATTLAILFHEIPQEIGDFGVLLYGGFTRFRALLFNFSTAATAILGAIIALSCSSFIQDFIPFIIPFAAGNFIYIAGSDLIPELRKEEPSLLKSLLQITVFVFGAFILLSLVLWE
ncbi:MAG: ZIP family metal transporter [Candidatus Bathyarchaeota archaeon]|nr:MAG: ZIP family metal transporter [Candidatus Bathyarchaeota archaeon]